MLGAPGRPARWLAGALHRRVTAIALAVLAATLAAAALLTAELIRVDDRASLDEVLLGELVEVRRALPPLLEQQAGADGQLTAQEAAQAARTYQLTHAGSARHLAVLDVPGGGTFSTQESPAVLRDLVNRAQLPTGVPEQLVTEPSPAGDLRVLNAPLAAGGQQVGTVLLVGSLEPGRDQAREALGLIALAGGVGLLVGGAVLVVAVRRATAPLRRLAEAARAVDLAALPDQRVVVPGARRDDEVGAVADEVERMLERISRDEALRRRLLASVSHELRTPLAVAQGHLEVFELTGGGPEDSAATAAVLRRELDRLGRLVDDLTAVTRGGTADGASVEAVFVPDLLTALAERTAGLGLPLVEVQAEREAPPVVIAGDEDRVVQALLNLVLNARTHTPPQTRVRVAARVRDDGWVVLDVADDGPGMDPAVADVAFEPFVTTRDSGDQRGSGLGLSVVRAVTLAQGGRVDLATGPAGTTVSLAFPPER